MYKFYYYKGERLHNFTVAVGNTFDPSDQANFNPETYTLCAYEPGPLLDETGQMMCDTPVTGRYVTVYMYQTEGIQESLTICELQVFGELVPGKSLLRFSLNPHLMLVHSCFLFIFYMSYIMKVKIS